MSTNKTVLIKQIVQIILNYSNPNRIYLYGSRANGEADINSDIDIAYDDDKFKENYLIQSEVEELETLLKIDIKNIAFTEDRFTNRVKSTGKVLYSATKKLRAEDGLYNFQNALNKFVNIVDRQAEFEAEGYADVYLDIVVKRFEFTYEMAWKALKRYLTFVGIEARSPRMVFKEAYIQNFIEDEEIWLDMIEQRNLSSHIYDEFEIREILDKVSDYKFAFLKLKDNLLNF
ncbi:HI0074 family nucleotidyltransferase substrate-binding subunit [Candidatus Marithrix sp. Canyon 246]|uniref:HI0074 family nucleotidyltransferase substrate-binding subunit n=1 Tax=Candidatus Marithrix sp. Canyon 246 TaxID=1827136 RepID=UPI000849F288|nr:HI0074 family nucleotidyltransferase substrate-binding subunit [Candidatus Marithrix sp. Canyon 246]